ncbi:hypothetical protein HPB52_023625 [Rhipicephalus sanguineus]|uniref:CRAL-TRIO domain-containing protein n=1 Tax=Rhipicephalus sanguineus TaxID=34632 RepID=A0A9D4PT89_RHISA|nr:hypothetical protein HPB52_023625 [Rhipicephalus sanguineus]
MSGVYTKIYPDVAFDSLEDDALAVELRRVAEAELGETPAKRREALATLTQLLQAEPGLKANMDEEFLLRFLRVRKYKVESALQTIKNYYRNRASTESLYRDFLPCNRCMPMRLKAAHNVRQSYAFHVFLTLIRPFIKQKLAERIRLHGHNFESLHAEISPMALPEEYGGQRPPLDPEECWKAVDADKDYFAACSRYGFATNDEGGLPAEPEPQLQLTSL